MSLVDRVTVDRISTEARDIHFTRTVVTLLATVLWLAGWCAGKVLGGIWLAVCWSAVACKVGWTDARGSYGGG
jgi:hypothetical protein